MEDSSNESCVETPNEKCRPDDEPTAILRGHLDDPVAANLRQEEDDDDAADMNRLEVLDEAARNILASMYI